MKLRSAHNIHEERHFNPVTGHLSNVLPRRDSSRDESLRGEFAHIDGHTWFLYRYRDEVHFRIDNIVDLVLSDDIQIKVVYGTTNQIIITKGGAVAFIWDYRNAQTAPTFENDPTPFIEEEDFDFGLFVRNVANNVKRKRQFFA